MGKDRKGAPHWKEKRMTESNPKSLRRSDNVRRLKNRISTKWAVGGLGIV